MELIFRKLNEENPEDIRQFNELMDDLTEHAEDETVLKDRIRRINENPDAYLMVAEDVEHGKLCGSLIGITFGDFCELCRPVMVIENVVTHHEYQHRGIGRRMFAEIESWGRARNAGYAILCSGMNRTEAHQFYRAVGYDEIKGFKKYL